MEMRLTAKDFALGAIEAYGVDRNDSWGHIERRHGCYLALGFHMEKHCCCGFRRLRDARRFALSLYGKHVLPE